jgi:hypothetical protein
MKLPLYIRETCPIDRPQTHRGVGAVALRVFSDAIPGCIIPAGLLSPGSPEEQLYQAVSFFADYEPKGKARRLAMPAGSLAIIHTDREALHARDSTHRLHQIDPHTKISALVRLMLVHDAAVPSDTILEETNTKTGAVACTVFEGEAHAGDITLFNARFPHQFTTLGNAVDRPYTILNIGPRVTAAQPDHDQPLPD